MESSLLAGRETLRRHLGAGLAVAAIFAVVSASAGAQTTVAAEINVVKAGAGTPALGACSTQGAYDICVKPEPITTPGNPGDPVAIEWTVKTAGWTFVKNKGIVIKPMKNWKITGKGPTQYTATNKKEGGVPYKYEINVTDGKTLLPWDPTIMN